VLRDLARRSGAVLLHVESRRTGETWATDQECASWEGLREEDENLPSRWAANLARNVRSGAPALIRPRLSN
jgi:hypothetical protein